MKRVVFQFDSCDDCPFLRFNPDYNIGYDCGWDCGHDEGGFRIADEGSVQEREENKWHGTVECRIGQPFPDRCPLPDSE